MTVTIHTKQDFEHMRKAGKLAASVLDYITDYVKPGISTLEINDICHKMIVDNNAIPAPLNYRGFPKSVCTSVNYVVCHGIPSAAKILKEGDIVNIDVTVILNGWYGDTSRTYFVGNNIPIKAKNVTKAAYESMMVGIEMVAPGVKLGDIGYAIENHAKKYKFSSVRDYCGHGIGRVFHGEPQVLHYGKKNTGLTLEEGMFFTIEPMINVGSFETKLSQHDDWTVTTKDRSLSAQFEHTLGVTSTGYEIFTLSPKNLHHPNFK
jgi:methionyl aminopeptidase